MAGLRGRELIAYLIVCVVWGSTYLAIRIGVHDLPPVLFAGVRFLTAGLLLGAAVLATGGKLPIVRRDWQTLAIVGCFLLLGGNATVVWAEKTVESGLASVYVAAGPLWTAFFDAIIPGGKTRLTWRMAMGLLLGFLGICLLAGVTPGQPVSSEMRGPIALTLASASWAMGSVYSKRHPTGATPYAAAAVQMAVAGAVLTLMGLALGESSAWHLTPSALGALVYLIVFGSIVGYTAFGYALRNASATIVGTFAYVNPVVAVLLGWLILHEQVTLRTLAAMGLILGAVLWIQLSTSPAPALEESRPEVAGGVRRTTAGA
ncbi:MAG: EamA family transporter [Gemmatimonadales bacterium]